MARDQNRGRPARQAPLLDRDRQQVPGCRRSRPRQLRQGRRARELAPSSLVTHRLLVFPRGFAPRTPPHALLRAASPARSVRVARFAALARVFLRGALPRRSTDAIDGAEAGRGGPRDPHSARVGSLARLFASAYAVLKPLLGLKLNVRTSTSVKARSGALHRSATQGGRNPS